MVLVEAESDFVQVSPLLCRVLTDGSGCEDEVCVLFLASYSLKCYSVRLTTKEGSGMLRLSPVIR